MSTVLLAPTPVPKITDGMIVRVIYLGQQHLRYRNLDDAGRRVVPEFHNSTTGLWQDEPTTCTEPYEDARRQPKCLYDGIPYRLEINRECMMPIEAARLWFGDERSSHAMQSGLSRKGIRAWVNDRQTEIRRLRCMYNNIGGDETTIYGHPIVEVYTLDDERVPMVLDDPLGLNSTDASMTVAEQDDLHMLIRKQQEQLNMLQRQIDAQKAGPKSRAPQAKQREEVDEDDITPVPLSSLPEDPNG